jgi:cell division protein FtsB
MTIPTPRASLGGTIYLVVCMTLGAYFGFAAVQGDSGVLAQRQVSAQAATLEAQRDALAADLSKLQNLTLRLSDGYLDLDLLDERARAILGYVRAEEIVLR